MNRRDFLGVLGKVLIGTSVIGYIVKEEIHKDHHIKGYDHNHVEEIPEATIPLDERDLGKGEMWSYDQETGDILRNGHIEEEGVSLRDLHNFLEKEWKKDGKLTTSPFESYVI